MAFLDVFVYAARCDGENEHDAAYRLLAAAVKQALDWQSLPEIRREDGGKPFFPAHPDVCFNLSHSHGAVVCALHDKPVGVDIEKLRPAPRRLADGLDDASFFRLWTAKEASIKRMGLGVGSLLRPMEPDPHCQCLEGLLDGWVVTVCPAGDAAVRAARIE